MHREIFGVEMNNRDTINHKSHNIASSFLYFEAQSDPEFTSTQHLILDRTSFQITCYSFLRQLFSPIKLDCCVFLLLAFDSLPDKQCFERGLMNVNWFGSISLVWYFETLALIKVNVFALEILTVTALELFDLRKERKQSEIIARKTGDARMIPLNT